MIVAYFINLHYAVSFPFSFSDKQDYIMQFIFLQCKVCLVFGSDCIMIMQTEMPAQMEEKKLATWGTDVPDDLVLDQKLLAEALKKVYILLIFLTCS